MNEDKTFWLALALLCVILAIFAAIRKGLYGSNR